VSMQILKSKAEVLTVATGEDGKFSFEHLDAGNYEIQVKALGYLPASFHIVVVKSKTSGKRVVQI